MVCVWYEGLADEVRADFNVMKDLAVHTRIGPADRVKRLQKFITDITRYQHDSMAISGLCYRFSLEMCRCLSLLFLHPGPKFTDIVLRVILRCVIRSS